MSREPINRPAPGRLEAVRAFVNTLDLDRETDQLDDTHAVAQWLARAGLLSDDVPCTPGELAYALRTREAFRGVLVANADGGRAAASVAVLNGVAADAGIAVRLTSPSMASTHGTAEGVTGAMGGLMAIAFEAIADSTWTRLKACPAERCHWAFYDASRNRSSRWCDMAICGNRAKHMALRRRGRQDRSDVR